MKQHLILESMGSVTANSSYVKTNILRVKEVAKTLSDCSFPSQRYGFYPELDREGIIQFAFVFNSVNFQFREFEHPRRGFDVEYNGGRYRGAFGLAYSLRKAVEHRVPVLDAEYLSNLTEKEALKFLKGRSIVIPMFKERVVILSEIGRVLAEKYDGQFSNFLKLSSKAFNNGEGLVERLVVDFPSFNDTRIYKPTNTEVKFYKRAQLLMAMLHYNPKLEFKLDDIDKLTVFADYRLPQALRDLGILKYSTELANKIDNYVMIPGGSDEEVEIRAHTIYASDLLCREINKHRKDKVTSCQIDEYLWLEGKESKKPRHFTKTTSY